jgi:hypothetical protein
MDLAAATARVRATRMSLLDSAVGSWRTNRTSAGATLTELPYYHRERADASV